MKLIGLLDCNNFFVSCERLFRPELRTVPTVVLSSNDGCVVARSKEIKEMGIPMGVPYFKVKNELKAAGAAVFSSNFTLYRDISARVMMVLREEMDEVEQYSVDEAFFALEVEDEDRALEALQSLKREVERKVGVPVSVGAAKTKTIAKFASEVGKKGPGAAVLVGESWRQITAKIPVYEIWGIGRKTSEKLHNLGVMTVADYIALDPARIDKLFGIAGLRMQAELQEQRTHRLGESHTTQKSIMSTRSFKKETTEMSVVADALAYHVNHAAAELRAIGMKAQHIAIMARTNRHGDWFMRGGSAEALLDVPTDDTVILLREAQKLFKSIYEPGVPYKKAGVVLSLFSDAELRQGNLFTATEQAKNPLMTVIDTLNHKFGNETIAVGRSGLGSGWKTSKAFVSPSYTTKWPEIKEIKA